MRRRVAVTATTAFLALFATISVQMATGNDPVTGTAASERDGELDVGVERGRRLLVERQQLGAGRRHHAAVMSTEASTTFACFGSHCGVWAAGDGRRGSAEDAVALAERSLLSWHRRFTRFERHERAVGAQRRHARRRARRSR